MVFIVGDDGSRNGFADGTLIRILTTFFTFAQSLILASVLAFGGYSFQYMNLKDFNNLL